MAKLRASPVDDEFHDGGFQIEFSFFTHCQISLFLCVVNYAASALCIHFCFIFRFLCQQLFS